MRKLMVLALVMVLGAAGWAQGETYQVDPVHSFAVFKIKHANAGYVFGRFNDPTGTFELDEQNPENNKLQVTLKVENIDTANEQRDAHLRSPDFFNAKQHPEISFTSTAWKKLEENKYEVTGDIKLMGETKSVTIEVETLGPAKD